MQKFFDFMEASEKTALFTFGRFNPPTIGHEKLLKKVASVASKNNADFFIYASHSESPTKDPLPYAKKIAYMKKMFPKYSSNIIASATDKTPIDVAVSLHKKGYTSCIMVVGGDRVKQFTELLSKYNGVEARHGYYKFNKLEIVSAGERDPDSEGVTGMSASKMRAAAASNDFNSFSKGLPKGFGDGKKLFDDVRMAMGVKESFINRVAETTDDHKLRDAYVNGKIFNIGDIVEDINTGAYGKVVRRGTNYLVFAEADGTIHKNWLFEVKQDPEIKDREGTQPAKYYAKDAEGDEMSKSTKAARARHFEKGAKKDDNDSSAYEPAPGDKSAKTKPSKYTKAVRKKYPELYDEGKADASLEKKAKASSISVGILKKVYKRGVAAWRTGHRPGTTPEQWGHARVNSFISGGKTRTTADADLWKQHSGKSESLNIESFVIESNIYRVGSEKYFEQFRELRELYQNNFLDDLTEEDIEVLETDIGEFAVYEGQHVPLDCPMIEEEDKKDVELNKPKKGGPKKYYVYVKDPSTGNIKKVTWGDTTGLKVKLNDPEARKSFAARHKCSQQKDRTTAAYWACNLPRYAKQLGLSGGGNFFW